MATTLLWLRQDLRLADHPALHAALDGGGAVVPVFVWSPEEEGTWAPASASRWWLHHSLTSLAADLERRGSRLVVRQGPTERELDRLLRETQATQVLWQRRYEPASIARDTKIKGWLREHGVNAESFPGSLLLEPWAVKTKEGGPYQVYTPFWKACLAQLTPAAPLPIPESVPGPKTWPKGVSIQSLDLLPRIKWDVGFHEHWQPGEVGAGKLLSRFLKESLGDYSVSRNRPDEFGTSRLSPHLHFGEITPRQIWHAVAETVCNRPSPTFRKEAEVYQKEVVWREFAHHLLYHFPKTTDEPLRPEFAHFPWRPEQRLLRTWQRGQTGYPIVDAGMRELWTTGWMHNRVRMIVASFLVKHLLQHWQDGTKWFWDTLVDADLANNTLGWQWTAGCGADAAPYFRIFNPILQGQKFDPAGNYVRRWVPELAALDTKWLHEPWAAPPDEQTRARVTLGTNYPAPIVDHATARAAALAAWEELKQRRS